MLREQESEQELPKWKVSTGIGDEVQVSNSTKIAKDLISSESKNIPSTISKAAVVEQR